jgi:hypothetical protein
MGWDIPGTTLQDTAESPSAALRNGKGLSMAAEEPSQAPNEPDAYFENGFVVYTAAYHLKRGVCCGSGCRHCPYEPRHVEGNTRVGP